MAKLPQGIRKRTNGSYEKRFTVNKVRYSIYGNTVKEIQAKEQDIRQKIENGNYKANKSITLDAYVKEWAEQKRAVNKANSIRSYIATYENHIKKQLGKVKIQDIEKRHCLEIQKTVAATHTTATTNYVITVLKIILNSAVDDEIISTNPCKSVKALPKVEKKANETIHKALTEQEQKAFMEQAKGSYYYELFATLLLTGCRLGEICVLKWSDIDFNANVIHINKTASADENGKRIVNNTPKTKASIRDIPLTEPLRAVLKAQKIKSEQIYSVCGYNLNMPLFCSINGGILTTVTVNDNIRAVLKALKKKGIVINNFTCHAFRDTFATRFIEQNGNPQTLKTILGHSSLALTMDLYAQVLPNIKQAEMEKLKIII